MFNVGFADRWDEMDWFLKWGREGVIKGRQMDDVTALVGQVVPKAVQREGYSKELSTSCAT